LPERKNRLHSFDFAAKPQNQTKQKFSSTLPQPALSEVDWAKKPLVRPAPTPTE
jgi:hypothetical protein